MEVEMEPTIQIQKFNKKRQMNFKNEIIFLILIFLISPVLSLDGQSFEEIFEEAIQGNLELKILHQEYLAVSATQMFPWFGLIDRKKALENAKAKALYERIAARQLTIRFELEQVWYQLYERQEHQKIIKRNIQLLEVLERLALSKMESGKGTAADAIRVQLKIKEWEQEIKILDKENNNNILIINQLTNQQMNPNLIVEDSLSFSDMPFSKDTLLNNITTHHPMIKMYALQQDISKAALALNERSGKPSIGLGLDYIVVGKRDDMLPSENGRDIVQVRATMKIPLQRQKYQAKEKEEQFKIKALEYQKTDAINQFYTQVETAFNNYETAQLKQSLYEQQIELTKSAINILQTKYSAQGEGFDEVLRLQKELIDYDLKTLKVIVESHKAVSLIRCFIFQ